MATDPIIRPYDGLIIQSRGRDAISAPLTKPADAWDALQPQYAQPLAVPEFTGEPRDPGAVVQAWQAIPSIPYSLFKHYKGPEPVGIPIELPDGLSEAEADGLLVHAWAFLYQRIVQDSKLPITIAGRLGTLNSEQAAFMVWLDAGPTRLVVMPMLRRYGRTISIGLAHTVLCHQGWMTGHDPRIIAHCVDLCTNYEMYFHQQGRAYTEYTEAFHNGNVYWHHIRTWLDKLLARAGGRWGWGEGHIIFTTAEYPGTEVFFSKVLNSFYHFSIGEPLVPEGSPPGNLLRQISTLVATTTMQWAQHLRPEDDLQVEVPRRSGVTTTFRENH